MICDVYSQVWANDGQRNSVTEAPTDVMSQDIGVTSHRMVWFQSQTT